jgi:polar amino acid transport system permease protein
MDVELIRDSLPLLLQGTLMTLKVTGVSCVLGLVLGTLIGIGRTWDKRWLSLFLVVYVEAVRGTPLYTQLLLVVFGIPQITGINLDEFTAGVVTIGLNSSAYVAEIIRGGIVSIDRGQMEAARSLGMSRAKAMGYVILPQALRRAIPSLVNEVISMIKGSSLVATIALVDLTRSAQMIASRTYKPFPPLLMAALIYLVMTLSLSHLAARLERRLMASD